MISLLAPTLLAAAVLPAQQSDEQKELVAKYEEKLTAEYLEFGGWVTDYDEARARAKAEGKLLFTYFSRSYSP